jgi:hypothetical protein
VIETNRHGHRQREAVARQLANIVILRVVAFEQARADSLEDRRLTEFVAGCEYVDTGSEADNLASRSELPDAFDDDARDDHRSRPLCRRHHEQMNERVFRPSLIRCRIRTVGHRFEPIGGMP